MQPGGKVILTEWGLEIPEQAFLEHFASWVRFCRWGNRPNPGPPRRISRFMPEQHQRDPLVETSRRFDLV